jgi:uncharacterized protein YlaI
MFLTIKTQRNQYSRLSKTGVEHVYTRKKTLAILRCDVCDSVFERDLKHMDKKRLSNNYFHCCADCDAKRFAQRKGVEQKQIWNMPASVDLPVSKF